jgi:hypothetical protein
MPEESSIFTDALAVARAKGLLPTTLSSAELRKLSADVRRRAVFSARLDQAVVLQKLKENLEFIAGGGRDEFGRIRSLAEAKAQLREAMRESGMIEGDGGLTDHLSDARRQLIIETNVLDTLNFGRWKAGQDELTLDMLPAWELVRMVTPIGTPRDWELRWREAADATTWEGVSDPGETGRMVALKNHPIWQALGDGAGGFEDTLGNPWPPFAFRSGMNVADVPREEAVELGLISDTAQIPPAELTGLNDGLEASVENLDMAFLGDIAQLGMQVVNGVLRLVNATSASRGLRLVNMADANGAEHDESGRFAHKGGGTTGQPVVIAKGAGRGQRQKEAQRKKAVRKTAKALTRSLDRRNDSKQRSVPVPGVGTVEIPYGHPGNKQATSGDGYGATHVASKHPEDFKATAETLQRGKKYPHERSPKKLYKVHKDNIAVLKKAAKKKATLTTHYSDPDKSEWLKKIGPQSKKPGAHHTRKMLPAKSWVQPGLHNRSYLLWRGRSGASKALNIAQTRAHLQSIFDVLTEQKSNPTHPERRAA